MKLQQLIYFVEICNSGSISKASARLYVSQPSVSSAIKELEKSIGVTLFRRVNKKLYITAEGQHLYARTIVILEELNKLKEEVRSISSTNHLIKLGLPMQVSSFLLPSLLGAFHKIHPNIQLEIMELGSLDLLHLLEDDQLDLAVMACEDAQHYQVNFQPLFKSEFCLFTHPDNPLALQAPCTVEDIGNEPLALPSRLHVVNGIVLKRFSAVNCQPNIFMNTASLHTLSTLISQNMASSILLRETILGTELCKKISLNPPMPTTVGIATAKDAHLSPQVKDLIHFLETAHQQKP